MTWYDSPVPAWTWANLRVAAACMCRTSWNVKTERRKRGATGSTQSPIGVSFGCRCPSGAQDRDDGRHQIGEAIRVRWKVATLAKALGDEATAYGEENVGGQ